MRFRWQTRTEEYAPPEYFVDVQPRGLYKRQHHRHTFEEAPGGTLMQDVVDYELPFGLLAAAARPLFVRRSAEQILDYRNKAILEILGKR